MLKKNRLAVKIAGRDNGVCVVLGKRKDRLLVIGPRVRKRLVSPSHLEPLPGTLDVSGLEDEEIVKKLKKADEDYRHTKLGFIEKTSVKAKLRQ